MDSIRKLNEWWLDTHRVMDSRLSREFSEAIDADEWRDADNKIIAATAAKLRLAGEDE